MPAVLYDGYAFTYGGKLYVGDTCPPCCCVPDACCVPTQKWHCAATDDFRFPKKVNGSVSVSLVADVYRIELKIERENPYKGGTGRKPEDGYRFFHRIVEVSGLSALNGTYIGAFDSSCPNYDDPESCQAWANRVCSLWAPTSFVPLSVYYYEKQIYPAYDLDYVKEYTGTGTAGLSTEAPYGLVMVLDIDPGDWPDVRFFHSSKDEGEISPAPTPMRFELARSKVTCTHEADRDFTSYDVNYLGDNYVKDIYESSTDYYYEEQKESDVRVETQGQLWES